MIVLNNALLVEVKLMKKNWGEVVYDHSLEQCLTSRGKNV